MVRQDLPTLFSLYSRTGIGLRMDILPSEFQPRPAGWHQTSGRRFSPLRSSTRTDAESNRKPR